MDKMKQKPKFSTDPIKSRSIKQLPSRKNRAALLILGCHSNLSWKQLAQDLKPPLLKYEK